MIKIKLYELEKHRNETTLRPFIFLKNLFRDVGIEFVTDGKSDFAFIAQASIVDKKLSLENSIKYGLNFLKNVREPYFLFDGQDSTSLIGTYDVFKQSNATYLFKYILLKNKELYKQKWVNGRYFWGEGNYSCSDFDSFKDRILPANFNWMCTYGYNLKQVSFNKKRDIDISALFGVFSKENYEHEIRTDLYYNKQRFEIFSKLEKLKYNIVSSQKIGKLPFEDYQRVLLNSKIYISPYGYGEYAIRDLEVMCSGCILLKPTMENIEGNPNIFSEYKTYIPLKKDLSDLEEKVDFTLKNYKELQHHFYNNINKMLVEEFGTYKVIKYYYDIFLKESNITVE